MSRGSLACKLPLLLSLILNLLFGFTASAAGYYNFGMQWKGTLNPYQFGADITYYSGFTKGLGTSGAGAQDGSLSGAGAVAMDSSGNFYVTDSNNHRISKYNSSGVFQGWIGAIATSPTGGAAGCNGAAVGTFTPGWCTGGASTFGTGDGMMKGPSGIALDSSGNLYVGDSSNNRISKYNSSGVFQGWIGKIATSPTGGAAGCNGASVGTVTPGWCTGGTATTGNGDGVLLSPRGIALDSSGNFYVADMSNHIYKYNSSGVFQGWIGKIGTSPTGGAAGCNGASVGTFTPGWCTGGASTSGTGDGMMINAYNVALDSSGNLYVVESNSRVNKYNSSGVFQGWIGKIATSPTGGAAGCNGASVGTFTPGWCKGGTSTSGTGDGMVNGPMGIALDSSGNLYVVDTFNSRVSKYNSSGAFQGWIGKIATSPTGGAAGCNGASGGTFTPGWCTGGTSTSGSGDGMMNVPNGIILDSSGNLYVADSNNSRIDKFDSSGALVGAIQSILSFQSWHRYGSMSAPSLGTGDGMMSYPFGVGRDSSGNLYVADNSNSRINKYNSSGVFQGWIGNILTSPTGGAAGCNGASVGTFTPGWCTGGTPDSGTGDGMMYYPDDVAVDSSGNLYVADYSNNRINKYNSSGVFQGWIGKIATSPTGGAAGCNGASVGTFTPGWCKGGTSTSGTGDGMMNGPGGISLDSSGNLYVADYVNNRINKYNSSGVFQGWIGKIATSPTGGAAGCNGASVGTFTPGWCKGGTSASGTGDGMMNSPGVVRVDSSGNLYVTDYANSRVNKYNSSGAFQGWIGKIATSPTGGAAGCNGASVGTVTPGWCTGGTSTFGTGDGMMSSPYDVALDSTGNFYVSDDGLDRISKYNSSGVFQGWIGNIATSPTGGAAGCKGAAVGTFTPGWCKGGTSTSGTGDGMMDGPEGMTLDSSGNLYVVDCYNGRIIRFSTQGR